MFVVEEIDDQVLSDPLTHIIQPGGKYPSLGVVGACALLKKGQGIFELTKMGVLQSARGLKVGEQLLQYVLKQCAAMKAKKVFLLTNQKCQAAIHLYEKNGFEHSQQIMQDYGSTYARADVAMLLARND